jgi:phosphoribosylformylglycinamidine (FGAM) synthase-like enzyme
VPQEALARYLELSVRRRVESTPLGRFTDSGYFHVRYGERTVAYLELTFLHQGDPPYHLEAVFAPPVREEPLLNPSGPAGDHGATLRGMVRRLNLASGEGKARQYDHEVQGRSIIKPYGGVEHDVPTDATLLRADPDSWEGILLSEGINPFYSDIDPYWMAASVLDLAVRRVVASGGDPEFVAALDNFCWPNVVKKEMPERSHKLAQLVRACEGLYDTCRLFGVPLISGKDSMSNDSTLTDPPISVPPTLLVSVIGRIPDFRRAVTPDLKAPGDAVYLLGETADELGASELYRYYGELAGTACVGTSVPRVDAPKARSLYRALHRVVNEGLVRSCHTPAMGGLALALVRCAFAGGLGLDVQLSGIPGSVTSDLAALYAESNSRFVVSVAHESAGAFERALQGHPCARVGTVRPDALLRVHGRGGRLLLEEPLEPLKQAWKEALGDP